MQLKLFVLPIKNLAAAEAEMNAFLRGHRVLAVKKQFEADGAGRSARSTWKNLAAVKARWWRSAPLVRVTLESLVSDPRPKIG